MKKIVLILTVMLSCMTSWSQQFEDLSVTSAIIPPNWVYVGEAFDAQIIFTAPNGATLNEDSPGLIEVCFTTKVDPLSIAYAVPQVHYDSYSGGSEDFITWEYQGDAGGSQYCWQGKLNKTLEKFSGALIVFTDLIASEAATVEEANNQMGVGLGVILDGHAKDIWDANDYSDVFIWAKSNGELSVDAPDFDTFEFYPNPTRNLLNLRAAMLIETVEMFNMLGKEVISVSPQAQTAQINMQGLASGTYFMNVTINGTQETFKVIKKE